MKQKRNSKGLGSIRKRYINGYLYYEYRYTDNMGRQVSTTSKSKKELIKKVQKIQANLLNGYLVKNKKITVKNIYLNIIDTKLNSNIITQNTYKRNLETLKQLEKIGLANFYVDKLTIPIIENAFIKLIGLNYSQSVIKKVRGALGQVFKESIKYDLIHKNLIDYINIPKAKKETKKVTAFTEEEQKRLLEIIDNSKYYMQYLISLNTGLRIGEINALQVKNINFDKRLIHVENTVTRNIDGNAIIGNSTKTYNGLRSVYIPDTLFNILKDYIAKLENNNNGNTYLFLTKRKKFINHSAINSEFNRLNAKYKFCLNSNNEVKRVNTHMLRHTFATRCIEKGVPAEVLKQWLGHYDIKVTINTYVDVFNKYQEKYYNKLDYYFNND